MPSTTSRPKAASSAARVAAHRRRQRQAGMISVTVVVPQEDARFFREMAGTARRKKQKRTAGKAHEAANPPRLMPARQLRQAERWAVASGLKLRLSRPGLKLAEVLAHNIAYEIVGAGWQIGSNLGSERELQARYGVGRNLLRRAIGQLEQQSVVQVRRGAGGGVIVAEPTLESTAYSAALYLEYRKIKGADLRHTRRGLQLLVLERCMDHLDAAARARLRGVLESEERLGRAAASQDFQRLDLAMAQLTRNPALELLMDMILRLYRFHSRTHQAHKPAVAETLRRIHRELVTAMLAGNRASARKALERYLDYVDKELF